MEYTRTLRRAFSLRARSPTSSPELGIRAKDKNHNKVKMRDTLMKSLPHRAVSEAFTFLLSQVFRLNLKQP